MTTLHATFIGTATVLLELSRGDDRVRLLTDPVFDQAGASQAINGMAALRYTSLSTAAVRPDALPPIDAVLLSHDQHIDNFDSGGRRVAQAAGQVLTTVAGARRLAKTGFSKVRGLAAWESISVAVGNLNVRITATPARHGPPLSRPFVGAVTGFLVEWTDGETGPLWISGDTVWHRALRPLADKGIGVAIVHAGAASFRLTSRVRYTMDGPAVARMARELAPRTICPIHYSGWTHFRHGRAEVSAALEQRGLGARCLWLPLGIRTEIPSAGTTKAGQ